MNDRARMKEIVKRHWGLSEKNVNTISVPEPKPRNTEHLNAEGRVEQVVGFAKEKANLFYLSIFQAISIGFAQNKVSGLTPYYYNDDNGLEMIRITSSETSMTERYIQSGMNELLADSSQYSFLVTLDNKLNTEDGSLKRIGQSIHKMESGGIALFRSDNDVFLFGKFGNEPTRNNRSHRNDHMRFQFSSKADADEFTNLLLKLKEDNNPMQEQDNIISIVKSLTPPEHKRWFQTSMAIKSKNITYDEYLEKCFVSEAYVKDSINQNVTWLTKEEIASLSGKKDRNGGIFALK